MRTAVRLMPIILAALGAALFALMLHA